MSRIVALDPEKVQGKAKELLGTIKAKAGGLPNIFKTMAHSPVALQAYLGLSGALAQSVLSAQLKEKIALAVGEENQCAYCLAAHSAIGKKAGLSDAEIETARRAKDKDAKESAILQFAKNLCKNRGNISDQELQAVRQAGCSDEEIIEVVVAVSLNIFTNYFNHVAEPTVDFPQAKPLS